MQYTYILVLFGIGIGATLLTDLWNQFLRLSFSIRSLNFCFLGRWIMYMPKGKFRHHNIAETAPKQFECIVGWMAHYSIGIILTLFFALVVSADWFIKPTFLPALFYGIATVVFPLFVLQPSLGLGLASANTPYPLKARIKSIMTHIVFGVGIWLSAVALRSHMAMD
jgi:hypothetical protein